MKDKIHNPFRRIPFLDFLFFWIRYFYPDGKGVPTLYLLYFFFPQKILRINGFITWPTHFTSRVFSAKKIKVGIMSCPGMNSGCYIQAKNGIEIGHNLRMGPNVGLISANHSLEDYETWEVTTPIKIGDNVWLGMGVVVLPGVEIGNNVVIAANSVVNKSIPSNVIAGGIPCKVLKEKGIYMGFDYSTL